MNQSVCFDARKLADIFSSIQVKSRTGAQQSGWSKAVKRDGETVLPLKGEPTMATITSGGVNKNT